MGCGGIRATNNELDAIRDAVLTGAGIAAFNVFGAGVAEANGVYVREGRYDGRPCFKNGRYWIAFYSGSWWLTDSTKSELDAEDDATADDEEFYQLDDDALLPATFGWVVAEKGKAPVPRIEAVIEGPVCTLGHSVPQTSSHAHIDSHVCARRRHSWSRARVARRWTVCILVQASMTARQCTPRMILQSTVTVATGVCTCGDLPRVGRSFSLAHTLGHTAPRLLPRLTWDVQVPLAHRGEQPH